MTTKKVGLADLPQYIGRYISFYWSDGWEDWHMSGYLHGIHEGYVATDDRPTLDPGETPRDLGGVLCDQRDEFAVYLTGAPSWARKPEPAA